MKVTSKRTILFRKNVNRNNEEWAHFLEGYRQWLMNWDMMEYGDDWHTAEDIVSEIYLDIITEPAITNMRPQDTFRHTLLVLCKHKHREMVKPWRTSLMSKLCLALKLEIEERSDPAAEIAAEFLDLVERNLMDKSGDGRRAFTTFSKTDLKRWRARHAAAEGAKNKDIAKLLMTSTSAFCKSCKTVDGHIVETVREIMRRRGWLR